MLQEFTTGDFCPPLSKGGGGDFWYRPAAEIPPSPLFQRGDFLHYLGSLTLSLFLIKPDSQALDQLPRLLVILLDELGQFLMAHIGRGHVKLIHHVQKNF